MKIENAEVLKQHLDKLISDDTYLKIELDYITPDNIGDMLSQIDNTIDIMDNPDFNGWEHDFWMPFKYNGYSLSFTGSWFYGGYNITKE